MTVNKGEEIYEVRIYPCRFEEKEFKFLSKIDKKTKEITFILYTEGLKTKELKGTKEYYEDFIARFERDLSHVVDLQLKRVFTKNDIIKELKGE